MEGKDGFSIYQGIDIQNYAEDDPGKYAQMISWLTQADYLVLSSNRLYGSIPRLPTALPDDVGILSRVVRRAAGL